MRYIIIALIMAVSSPAYAGNVARKANIDDSTAILAVLGEESNYQAQVLIGASIRHRGSLRGVYGHKSTRILKGKYTRAEYDQAKRAWYASASVKDAPDGWGCASDIKKWRKQSWFKNCYIFATVGGTYFWKVDPYIFG